MMTSSTQRKQKKFPWLKLPQTIREHVVDTLDHDSKFTFAETCSGSYLMAFPERSFDNVWRKIIFKNIDNHPFRDLKALYQSLLFHSSFQLEYPLFLALHGTINHIRKIRTKYGQSTRILHVLVDVEKYRIYSEEECTFHVQFPQVRPDHVLVSLKLKSAELTSVWTDIPPNLISAIKVSKMSGEVMLKLKEYVSSIRRTFDLTLGKHADLSMFELFFDIENVQKNLRSLRISACDDLTWAQIMICLRKLTRLSNLTITGDLQMNEATFTTFAHSLGSLQGLQSISLRNSMLTQMRISELTMNAKSLKRLTVSVPRSHVNRTIEIITQTQIEALDLSIIPNEIQRESFVLTLPQTFSNLRELHVDARSTSLTWPETLGSLTKLKIQAHTLENGSSQSLIKSLTQNSLLEELTCRFQECPSCLHHLFDGIQQHPSIQRLTLSPQMKDTIVPSILRVLETNTILRKLDLRYNSISIEGALQIARALEKREGCEVNLVDNDVRKSELKLFREFGFKIDPYSRLIVGHETMLTRTPWQHGRIVFQD